MPKSGWTLIETLEPGRLTVVARDHEARDRTSFERAVTDQLGIGKAPGHEAAQWLEALIADMRSHPEAAATHRVLRNGHTVSARLVPVIGPDNALHGAHVWLGTEGTQPHHPPESAIASGGGTATTRYCCTPAFSTHPWRSSSASSSGAPV
ncbi:GAF domain-containing protein [Nocardia cyriacigeorgica]|uniref:GAF domain-containing protein n=1 Tax=Nocardia cyriacigeorgica TaxID=135487 RepID=UPI003D78208B